MRILAIVAFVAVAAVLAYTFYWFFHVPTSAEKLARFQEEAGAGGKLFPATIAGREEFFFLQGCKVYLLDLTPDRVKKEKVLEPALYPWFTTCDTQEIRVEGEYFRVFLRVVAFGAGGGNQGGGEYRSKDGRNWEKQTDKGWRPVKDVQG